MPEMIIAALSPKEAWMKSLIPAAEGNMELSSEKQDPAKTAMIPAVRMAIHAEFPVR